MKKFGAVNVIITRICQNCKCTKLMGLQTLQTNEFTLVIYKISTATVCIKVQNRSFGDRSTTNMSVRSDCCFWVVTKKKLFDMIQINFLKSQEHTDTECMYSCPCNFLKTAHQGHHHPVQWNLTLWRPPQNKDQFPAVPKLQFLYQYYLILKSHIYCWRVTFTEILTQHCEVIKT